MTKLLLVDDDPFNREAMCLFLRSRKLDVVEAADAKTAWEIATTQIFDVAVLDIVIPPGPLEPVKFEQSLGVELAIQIKGIYPTLGIVLFSAYEDRATAILTLIQDGMRGIAYKLKGCQPSALWQAIEAVQRGQVIIDPEVTNHRNLLVAFLALLQPEERTRIELAAAQITALSPRELEVAEMVAAAYSNQAIAHKLVINLKSVENHLSKIYNKLGLHDGRDSTLPLRKAIILAKALMLHQLKQ